MPKITRIIQVVGPPVDTGITVSTGDVLIFDCIGFINQGWRLGDIIVDGNGAGPNGNLNDDRPAGAGYPLRGSTRYALMGEIVSTSGGRLAAFSIGKYKVIFAPADGLLRLLANDDNPADNRVVSGPGTWQTPWSVSVTRSIPDPAPPIGTPGLRIDALEVVQSVGRPFFGDFVLIGGKTTAVRAFLSVREPLPMGTKINGFVEVDGLRLPALNPSDARWNPIELPSPGDVPDRGLTKSSLNFHIPARYLIADSQRTHYTFKVTAYIGTEFTGFELPGYVTTDEVTAGFSTGYNITINLLRMSTPIGPSPTGPYSDPTLFMSNLWIKLIESQLPVPDGGLMVIPTRPDLILINAEIGWGDFLKHALTSLNFLRAVGTINPTLANGGIVMAVTVPLPPSVTNGGIASAVGSCIVSLADYKGDYSDPLDSGRSKGANNIALHELGHVCGLRHVEVGICSAVANPDPSLPKETEVPGWLLNFERAVPSGTFAIMSYCGFQTITAEEYIRIYRKIRASAL